ncbi:protein S-acyltransferase 10 isoform X3 [Hevea brasiliensis]|uniref:protein S-acyltransferase 10 isoform X3 n=1 Tax=Hevea brasiliensis TaxID=3981 RepID=UPI000B798240|nr:protein S-acyltransferase 10 isoform X3 [Hevea brasiliensis]
MTITSVCQSFFNGALDRCYRLSPCLADPATRSSLGLKVALVMLHLIYVGILFLFDNHLIDKTKQDPWYIALYLLLFIATLVQYFVTSGSSPGYVLDAMRALNEKNAVFAKASMTAKTLTCSYCNVEQPPRAKHCHDCDKCVLQFDHHCVWLGTCIGWGNHCRFWWYICEETALCLWTDILCIAYLKANIIRAWWKDAIMILLLVILSISLIFLLLFLLFHSYLILTNQTTYELVRRRRIPYLRGIPERVYPFSKGVCRNLYEFCCARSNIYKLERLPTAIEIEEKSRPHTCLDFLTCRCC